MKNSKKAQEKNKGLLLTAAVILVLCMAVVITAGRNGRPTAAGDDISAAVQEPEREDGSAVVVEEGEALMIPAADVTTEASFFPVEVDGTRMEVIAVRDKDGNIRTAFNTCQICYGSGRGYYVQMGDVLVCQNCGNRFTVEQVEIESGGCNPWPIFEKDKTIEEDYIEISYDFLASSEKIFANWKVSY